MVLKTTTLKLNQLISINWVQVWPTPYKNSLQNDFEIPNLNPNNLTPSQTHPNWKVRCRTSKHQTQNTANSLRFWWLTQEVGQNFQRLAFDSHDSSNAKASCNAYHFPGETSLWASAHGSSASVVYPTLLCYLMYWMH